MQLPQQQMAVPAPPLGRMMVFVDGENLAIRYGAMLDQGAVPHQDVSCERDTYVWRKNTVKPGMNIVIRAIYYTAVQGDEQKVREIAQTIKALRFEQYHSMLPGTMQQGRVDKLCPKVFKKPKNRASKGVDIQMTVDILTNVYEDNLDIVYLVAGDGDYYPIVDECIRKGKQVVVAALSSGLSDRLRDRADRYIKLDSIYFSELPKVAK